MAASARQWFTYETVLKRVLDVLLASVVLVATLPVWLAHPY